jgi:tetratricopeptide (TPR) repeat protein
MNGRRQFVRPGSTTHTVPTRRRFQAPHSRGSHPRARPRHQLPPGASEARRDDALDARKEEKEAEVTNDAAGEEQLWIVDVGEGQLQIVRGIGALKDLVAERRLAKTATVYVLPTAATTLAELAERPPSLDREPIAPAKDIAPAERSSQAVSAVDVDADFALLDRPFDDGDYFEDPPRSRWLRPAGIAALLVALGTGGYHVLHSPSAPRAPAGVQAHAAPTVVAPPAVEPPVAAATPAVEPTVAVPVAPPGPAAPEPAATQPPVEAARAAARYPQLVAEGERQFQSGHGKKAQALFEQALAETPEGNAALVGLAYVYLDRGNVPQAIALFQRALAQDHGDPTALFGLAESHRQAGNRSAALAEFQRFLTLRSSGNDADIARQLVLELSGGG